MSITSRRRTLGPWTLSQPSPHPNTLADNSKVKAGLARYLKGQWHIMRILTSTNSSARRAGVRRRTQRARLSTSLGLIALLSGLSVTALSAATAAASAAAATTTVRTSAVAVAGGLSGTWSGRYSGADNGTFILTWTQSGKELSGTIKISSPPHKYLVKGTVSGSSIRFGTLGGGSITYTGSVSGSSMSGTYHAPNGNGTWRATKR